MTKTHIPGVTVLMETEPKKIAVGEVVEVDGSLFRLVRFTRQRWTPPIVEFRPLEAELKAVQVETPHPYIYGRQNNVH